MQVINSSRKLKYNKSYKDFNKQEPISKTKGKN